MHPRAYSFSQALSLSPSHPLANRHWQYTMSVITQRQPTIEECLRNNKKRKYACDSSSVPATDRDNALANVQLASHRQQDPVVSLATAEGGVHGEAGKSATDEGVGLLMAFAASSQSYGFTFKLPSEASSGPLHSRVDSLSNLLLSLDSSCNSNGNAILSTISKQLKVIAADLKNNYVLKSSRSSGADAKQLLPILRDTCDRIKTIERDMRSLKNSKNIASSITCKSRCDSDRCSSAGSSARTQRAGTDLECLRILQGVSPETVIRAEQALINNELVKNNKISVEYFNVHPSGKVYVHCGSPDSAIQVGGILESAGIPARGVLRKRPRYLISPLPSDVDDNVFLKWIEEADPRFAAHKGSAIKKKLKLNSAQCALVLEVEHNLAKLIDQNPTINYRLKKVKLSRFFDLLQCKHCARYGHTDRHCRFRHLRSHCTTCGGPDCGLGRCLNPIYSNCANCIRLGHSDTNHPSWDKKCVHRRERIRCLSPP